MTCGHCGRYPDSNILETTLGFSALATTVLVAIWVSTAHGLDSQGHDRNQGTETGTQTEADTTYRGIVVAPENRCSPYDRRDYRYPQSVEQRIVASIGKVYGPYTGACFASTSDTDIEHMVSLSEAHDSGLCAASAAVKRAFASDVSNLTLASPSVNRHQKRAKDVAEWTPPLNACWFAARTLEVRRKYGLSIDRAEAEAVEETLSRCESTEMVLVKCASG